MSNISFMRNTVNYIEKLFNFYIENKKNTHQPWKRKTIKILFFKWNVFLDTAKWKMKRNINGL